MPFTIGGEWIPDPSPSSSKQPVKIIKEKRRAAFVTLILNLPFEEAQLKSLCSALKQRLGCGGSVKEGRLELQGDQVDAVRAYLTKSGIKVR